jgi:hypothetical protein
MEERAGDTTIWALAFLVIALAMTGLGVAWMLFGPPIL